MKMEFLLKTPCFSNVIHLWKYLGCSNKPLSPTTFYQGSSSTIDDILLHVDEKLSNKYGNLMSGEFKTFKFSMVWAKREASYNGPLPKSDKILLLNITFKTSQTRWYSSSTSSRVPFLFDF